MKRCCASPSSTPKRSANTSPDIARCLLLAHAEMAARAREALEREERRNAVTASVVDFFPETMPGGVPDMHHPATAVSSRGPGAFIASLRLGRDAQTAALESDFIPEPLQPLLGVREERGVARARQHDRHAVQCLCDIRGHGVER
jgi:hypothetical protein